MEFNSLKTLSLFLWVTCNLFAELFQLEIPFPCVLNHPMDWSCRLWFLDSWEGIIGHDWMQLVQLKKRLKNSFESPLKMVLINSKLESFYLLSIKKR